MHLPNFRGIRFNLVSVLWIVLFAVLVFDFLAVRKAYNVFNQARTEELGILPTKSVRVNFDLYDAALERIDGSYTFQPGAVAERNPFLPVPRRGE